MQLAEQQRQYSVTGGSGPCLRGHALESDEVESSVCGVVGHGLHGDRRLVAALVTSYGTSPIWPASGPPHIHLG